MSRGASSINNVITNRSYKSAAEGVLKDLYEALNKSYGPYGSTTLLATIMGVVPTKDGDTILSAIKYKGPIETNIKSMIESIASNIIQHVGDGTTTSVLMAKLLYDEIEKLKSDANGIVTKDSIRPKDLINSLKNIANIVSEEIEKTAKPVKDLDDVRHLATISLNNDSSEAENIVKAFDICGLDAQVNIEQSATEETHIKHYEGYTINYGYMDPTLINNAKGECELSNANVVIFDDGIKSFEWEQFLLNMLIDFYKNRPNENFLIIAPQYSVEALKLIRQFFSTTSNERTSISVMQVPVGTVSAWDKYMDIAVSTGANSILVSEGEFPILRTGKEHIRNAKTGEYIYDVVDATGKVFNTIESAYKLDEKNIQKHENGNPIYTPKTHNVTSTIDKHFGKVDLIQTESESTFILDKTMTDAQKIKFNERIDTIKFQIRKLEKSSEGKNINKVISLKNRLNILQGKLVTVFVGGITEEEKKDAKALYVDASLSVTSAIKHGYVYGASKAGMNAVKKLMNEYTNKDSLDYAILDAIHQAYIKVYVQIYKNAEVHIKNEEVDNELPLNVITRKFDKNIISASLTDSMILKSAIDIVSKISLSNQFILPSTEYATGYTG